MQGQIQVCNNVKYISYTVGGTRFDIDTRYQLIKPIGQGAFGLVW